VGYFGAVFFFVCETTAAGVAVADVYASLPLTSLLVVQKGIFVNQQRLVLQWLTFMRRYR
jgi:hypothetical protein